MDLFLRTLREGRADPGSEAPLLLLRDMAAVVGCPALLRHAVRELAIAIAGSRAAAAALTVVALQHPAWQYQQLCSMLPVAGHLELTVIDCFTDPYSWGGLAPGSTASGTGSAPGVVPLPGMLAAADGLQRLQQQLLGDSGSGSSGRDGQPLQSQQRRQTLVVFDSISPLLDAFPATPVAQLLSHLAAHPGIAGLLCGLHADLHPPAVPAAVEQLATGSLSLQLASDLERTVCAASSGRAPQGRAEVRLRRRTGRVRAESQLYCVDAGGAVAFVEPPPDVRNPAAAAEKAAAAAAAAAGPGTLAEQLAGGMKLSLSREEQEARQRVQLPFEHQGQGAAYQTGDWLDYLPPEAGGRAASRPGSAAGQARPSPDAAAQQHASQQAAPGQQQQQQQQQQLGRILYVRDSGSELDSDEDPDDDLDI